MKLSEAGELRVRGYLFMLHRSLATFMSKEMAQESIREVESHILARVAGIDGAVDEKEALEGVLQHLGPPTKVAQAYAAEITFEEAMATGRPVPVFRALWLVATSLQGFLASLGLLVGYALGLGFLIVALLKPVFPQNVGLILREGVPTAFGAVSTIGPGVEVVGGYGLIPLSLFAGAVVLLSTHRLARALVSWWRGRLKGPMDE